MPKPEEINRLLDHDTSSTHPRHNGLKFLDLAKKISIDIVKRWCPRTDSNRGPIDYKSRLNS